MEFNSHTTPSGEPNPGGLGGEMPSLADYTVESSLGCGTYGKVFTVRRTEDGALLVLKQVALAALTAKEQGEALNESRLMAHSGVEHERIIRYHESFIQSQHLNIVMAYCSGGDLAQAVANAPELGAFK